jgi:hypothetical protein
MKLRWSLDGHDDQVDDGKLPGPICIYTFLILYCSLGSVGEEDKERERERGHIERELEGRASLNDAIYLNLMITV